MKVSLSLIFLVSGYHTIFLIKKIVSVKMGHLSNKSNMTERERDICVCGYHAYHQSWEAAVGDGGRF